MQQRHGHGTPGKELTRTCIDPRSTSFVAPPRQHSRTRQYWTRLRMNFTLTIASSQLQFSSTLPDPRAGNVNSSTGDPALGGNKTA
eukprot:12091112-Prorocentrum_lima.AAC.1